MKFQGLEITGGTARFVFYGADGRKFVEPAMVCKDCTGEGEYMGEEPVVDYEHGGYLKEVKVTCKTCEGYGWVVQDGEEES